MHFIVYNDFFEGGGECLQLLIVKMFPFLWLCTSMRNFIAELHRRLEVELCFGSENLKSLLLTPKFPI